MKTKISTRIDAGDKTVFDDKLWVAEKFDKTRPCPAQCAMYDNIRDRCPGHCWRWKNGEDIVFHYLLPLGAVRQDTEVVATPDPLLRRFEGFESTLRAKTKYYVQQNERRRETTEKREFGSGTIFRRATVWSGEITVEGTVVRFSHPDKAEVERWLDDMAALKKALKELEKLNKGGKNDAKR